MPLALETIAPVGEALTTEPDETSGTDYTLSHYSRDAIVKWPSRRKPDPNPRRGFRENLSEVLRAVCTCVQSASFFRARSSSANPPATREHALVQTPGTDAMRHSTVPSVC